MSTFERDEFEWRETYYVLFDAHRRPSLRQVEKILRDLSSRFAFSGAAADEKGQFETITVISAEDYAAIDISYEAGEAVLEQGRSLYKELKPTATEPEERAQLARLPKLDARFDLLHFEKVVGTAQGEEADEMLDPSALLIVLEALVELTHGVGVDPQSGTLL